MNIHKKLQQARMKLQNTTLKKSGHNKFAGYQYFELGDFLPQIQQICDLVGLCGTVSFTSDMAYLTIYDTDSNEMNSFVTFTSPMSSAALKGCHDVQNLGAVQTYLRRYLWVNAFEIVEHDALEPLTGKEDPVKKPEPAVKPAYKTVGVTPDPKPPVAKPAAVKAETPKGWTLSADQEEFGSPGWVSAIKGGAEVALSLAQTTDDVANIFKNNRVSFDKIEEVDKKAFSDLMSIFSTTKKSLTKE
jgi:hypothetical protein